MTTRTAWIVAFGLCGSLAFQGLALGEEKTADNPNGCKVVERKDSNPSGSITSSVTAGGGKVSGFTTGGNSVSVHSKDGSSMATVGTTGSGGSTIVTNSDGSCTIYRNPGENKDK